MKALPHGLEREPRVWHPGCFCSNSRPLLKKDPHLSCLIGLHRIHCSLHLGSPGALGFCDRTSPWLPSCVSGCPLMFPFALPPILDLYMLEWCRVGPRRHHLPCHGFKSHLSPAHSLSSELQACISDRKPQLFLDARRHLKLNSSKTKHNSSLPKLVSPKPPTCTLPYSSQEIMLLTPHSSIV